MWRFDERSYWIGAIACGLVYIGIQAWIDFQTLKASAFWLQDQVNRLEHRVGELVLAHAQPAQLERLKAAGVDDGQAAVFAGRHGMGVVSHER